MHANNHGESAHDIPGTIHRRGWSCDPADVHQLPWPNDRVASGWIVARKLIKIFELDFTYFLLAIWAAVAVLRVSMAVSAALPSPWNGPSLPP